ncbi:MAG: hypothetical protein ACYTFV_16620, partial [Planctomycetota bacterium]
LPAAEELAPSPPLVSEPKEERVDEVEPEPLPEIDRRLELRSNARTIPGPSLVVQVTGPRDTRVSRGTVALVLGVDVREGKLLRKEDVRSALLASAPLNQAGQAIFESLPTMDNNQAVEVAVVAPGYDQRGKANQLKGERVTLLPGTNELELTLKEVKPAHGRIRSNEGEYLAEVEVLALPYEIEHFGSASDLRVHALGREGLRSGQPQIWSFGRMRGGTVDLPLCCKRRMYLYCLDPDWHLEPVPIKPGFLDHRLTVEPRPHLRVEHELVEGSWHEDFDGDPDQLAWRIELERLQELIPEYEGLDLETGDVWLRGLDYLDLSVGVLEVDHRDELKDFVESTPSDPDALRWTGRLFSGSLSSALEVNMLEVALLEEPQSVTLVPELFTDVESTPSVVRVLYPDGQDAPGTYAFDSDLGTGALYVGNDGHGTLELVPGWGDFRLAVSELEDEHERELWANDYRGWMITAVNRGEAGSVTHAFVDQAARLRVHRPIDHEERFAVRLSASDRGSWRRIDESPLSTEPVDWARLPHGNWLVERLDESGAVLDSLSIGIGRGTPAQLMGDGSLEPWIEDVAYVADLAPVED